MQNVIPMIIILGLCQRQNEGNAMGWLEVLTIAGAIAASWGGVYINNHRQFKAQKENHERLMKTEALTKASTAMSKSRLLLIDFLVLSAKEAYDSVLQNRIPSEFYLWASDETIQAALDLSVIIEEQKSHLMLLKFDINAQKEILNVMIENQHPNELYVKKESEIHALEKKLISESIKSYGLCGTAEIKVIICIRQEYGTSFLNKEKFDEMGSAYYNEFTKIKNNHDACILNARNNLIAEKRKYSHRASHN